MDYENELEKSHSKDVNANNSKENDLTMEKAQTMKQPTYPKSIFFIVSNEFCERFSFYGLRTILALYLKNQLKFTANTATVIYHVFAMICYFLPLFGAIIADNWLGKFRTILYLSIVYAIGNIVMSVAAIPNSLPSVEFTMVGLVLIAIGTGGIKPCVSAFGGDQFVLPEQEYQLQKFFSIFYFAINSGSFVSTLLTPILREIQCFEQDTCYSLAFGVPALLMIIATIIYIGGKSFYKIKKPEGNVIVDVSKCIWYAATKKSQKEHGHWLDKAEDKFDASFIEDIKATLRVLVLFIPLPIFWALFDQQGSRWTFQATRMNGEIGGIKIQPDQMQVVNPVLILIFIPLFQSVVYPVLAKCYLLRTPLQKLTVGGLLAAISFGVSALLEMQLEPTYPVLPKAGEGQIRLYNGISEPVSITIPELNVHNFCLDTLMHLEKLNVSVINEISLEYKYNTSDGKVNHGFFTVYEKKATSYTIMPEKVQKSEDEDIDKSDNGNPKIMIIYSDLNAFPNKTISFVERGTENILYKTVVTSSKPFEPFTKINLINKEYQLQIDGEVVLEGFEMKQGGGYVVLITSSLAGYSAKVITITKPNSVHILWLIPQYVIITAAEVMFSITGLEFSFTQAPVSMKSLLQAAWLTTVALGNLVVVIVAEAKIFESQVYEFLLFGGLMLFDMMIFAFMAMRYKYVDLSKTEKSEKTESDTPNS